MLGDVLRVEQESDGGLTVHHDGTFASLQVVNIVEDLDLVSLTQIVAWDLPLTKKTQRPGGRAGARQQLRCGDVRGEGR